MTSTAEQQVLLSSPTWLGRRSHSRGRSRPDAAVVCRRVSNQTWCIDESCVDEFLDRDGLRIADWLRTGDAVAVKQGPHRAVYRLTASSGTYFVKQYKVAGVRTWLQNNLRPCRAFRESTANQLVCKAGIPTAVQVAVGRESLGPFSRDSFIITQEIPAARPLDEWFIEQHQTRRGSLPIPRQHLIDRLATLTAALHRNGLDHADFHAGNILIRIEKGDAKLWLIDLLPLKAARMTPARRWTMLGMLLASLSPMAGRADQHRFFSAYQQAGGFEDDPWAAEAFIASDVHQRMARADRKWRRGNRRIHILDTTAVKCRGVAEFDRSVLTEWRDAIVCGEPPSRFGHRIRFVADGVDARHAWELGHALLRRGFPVAKPLLFVATASNGAIVTNEAEASVPLSTWLADRNASAAIDRNRVLSSLGRLYRRLHEAGFDASLTDFAVCPTGKIVIGRPEGVAQREMSSRRCRVSLDRLTTELERADQETVTAAYQATAERTTRGPSRTIGIQRLIGSVRGRAAVLLLALMVLVAGCRTLDKPPPVATLPAKHSVRADHLVLISDFRMPKDDPLVTELIELRNQVTAALKLPEPRQDVVVYLFSDEPAYRRYLESVHPGLPNRRAYFVGTKKELAVYTYWGDRIQEDLRHEYTHGILHSSLAGVPLWLDEGLAEYFEVPGSSVGGMNGDYPHQLAVAVANGWRPDVERLESINEFSQLKRVDYQEAWAWVHYMLHNSPDTRQTLLTYISELRDSPRPPALSDRLASVEPSFSARFLGYVVSLNTAGDAVIRAASEL